MGGKNTREAGGDQGKKDETKTEKELENKGGKGTELPALSEFTTLPKFLHVHQHGGSPNPLLWDFCGGFIITEVWLSKSLVFGG